MSIISIVLVSATWVNLRDMAVERVLDRVIMAASHFSLQARDILDRPGLSDPGGLQHELEAFIADRSTHYDSSFTQMGRFVYARIYDTGARRIASLSDSSYDHIAAVNRRMEDAALRIPQRGKKQHRVFRLNDKPLISVVAPLTSSKNEVVAYLEGVFAVSEAAMAAARIETLKTLAYVMAIVLTTATVLYPVILGLIGRLARTSRSLLDSHEDTLAILEKGRGTHFDTDLLDLFEKIAPDFYERLAGREDRQLKAMLGEISQKYFMDDTDTILARGDGV